MKKRRDFFVYFSKLENKINSETDIKTKNNLNIKLNHLTTDKLLLCHISFR